MNDILVVDLKLLITSLRGRKRKLLIGLVFYTFQLPFPSLVHLIPVASPGIRPAAYSCAG